MSMCTIYAHVNVYLLHTYMYPYTQTYTSLHKWKGKPMDELHDAFKLFVNLFTGPRKALWVLWHFKPACTNTTSCFYSIDMSVRKDVCIYISYKYFKHVYKQAHAQQKTVISIAMSPWYTAVWMSPIISHIYHHHLRPCPAQKGDHAPGRQG